VILSNSLHYSDLGKMTKKGWRYWFNLLIFGLVVFAGVLVIGIAKASHDSAISYLHPQRRVRSSNETPELYDVPFEDIILVTSDGIELAAWYTPSENGALILAAHGHGDLRALDHYVLFAQNGYGVLAWDFRAHGKSGGDFCTLGYLEALDVEAALEFGLVQPDVEQIGAWGASMGGAAVLEAAARRNEIEAVVIDSVFPTLEDELNWMVTSKVFVPFIRFFAERETGLDMEILRPVDRIGELSPRPVFIIQGEGDAVIPADSAQLLYEAAREPRYIWMESGINHVGMYSVFPEEYEKQVIGFFDEFLLRRKN
jgi:fermentation-respiration switch protein FrsA (DUF1100 family)